MREDKEVLIQARINRIEAGHQIIALLVVSFNITTLTNLIGQ